MFDYLRFYKVNSIVKPNHSIKIQNAKGGKSISVWLYVVIACVYFYFIILFYNLICTNQNNLDFVQDYFHIPSFFYYHFQTDE